MLFYGLGFPVYVALQQDELRAYALWPVVRVRLVRATLLEHSRVVLLLFSDLPASYTTRTLLLQHALLSVLDTLCD